MICLSIATNKSAPIPPLYVAKWWSATSRARASSATAPHLPDADHPSHSTLTASHEISHFRRDPFARDVLLDPGGTAMPRMTALHMLRSTISTVSAPANSSFRGSITHPTQPLCTLRVRRYRRLTQHSLPGDLLGLTWAGLAPADRASFAWRLPLLDHLVSASKQRRWQFEAERLCGLQVDGQLVLGLRLHRQ